MSDCVVFFTGAVPSGPEAERYLDMAYCCGRDASKAGFVHANGGTSGMMPQLARGGASVGGIVHGVALQKYANPIPEYATYRVFEKLRERQEVLIALGNAFVALPGGVGTAYEVLDIVCHMAIEQIPRHYPMICVGEEDHAEIDLLLKGVMKRGFGYTDVREFVTFVPHYDRALELLDQYRAGRG